MLDFKVIAEIIIAIVGVIMIVLRFIDNSKNKEIIANVEKFNKDVESKLNEKTKSIVDKVDEKTKSIVDEIKELKTQNEKEHNSEVKLMLEIKNICSKILEIDNKLYEMHNKTDQDGLYSWYIPRSWAETQKQIAGLCLTITNGQKVQADTLKVVADTLQKINFEISKCNKK